MPNETAPAALYPTYELIRAPYYREQAVQYANYWAYRRNPNYYSFDQLAGWGYSFALAGNEYRWQTFTATKDGTMEAVEVVLMKKDAVTEAFIDLHAELYAVADGMPTGEPLAVGTTLSGNQVNSAVAGQAVTDDMITRLELTCELEAGKQYAVVLKSSKVTGNGGDPTGEGQCYDWFCGTRNESEYFGKTNGVDPINWVDESGLGTAWMKVYYQRAPMTIDYSFETSSNGFGFGATGNEWRWQSFTSNQTAALRSLDLRVAKFDHNSESGLEEIHDLIVAVFATDDAGLPTGEPLAQATVPAENITYRLLGTWQEGLGTYAMPYTGKRHNVSFMAEATYSFAHDWKVRGAYAMDFGRILGNNAGFQLTVSKSGWF